MNTQENNQPDIDELIAGYFAQGLDNHELAVLHDWIEASDRNRAYFRQMQEVWFSAIDASASFRFDKEKAYLRFLARVEGQQETSPDESTPTRTFMMYVRRIAAAAAILVAVAGSGYWLGNNRVDSSIKDVLVEAPLGSRTKMYLPDGTMVWLNAGSYLSYSRAFGVKDRNVTLEGEGYFEVTKNKKIPFVVKTTELSIHVLGTKFNFRNYRDEEEARVSLLEGKVVANSGLNLAEEHSLTPNQRIILDKKTGNTTITTVNASHSLIWTQGLIYFDEEKLPDIAKELERSYNVKINISDDSLRNYRFYGNFTRNEQTIREVLDVLASTNRLTYTMNGKLITLSPK